MPERKAPASVVLDHLSRSPTLLAQSHATAPVADLVSHFLGFLTPADYRLRPLLGVFRSYVAVPAGLF